MKLKHKRSLHLFLFFFYIVVTILFYVGWNQMMYQGKQPLVVVSIATAIYFSGGAFVVPIGWFIFSTLQELKTKEQDSEISIKDSFIFRYVFPFAVFLNLLITYIFLNNFSKQFDLAMGTYIYMLIFLGLIFVILMITSYIKIIRDNSKHLVMALVFMSLIVVSWFLIILFSADFEEAAILGCPLIFSFSYKQIYYFLLFIGLLYLFFVIVLYFNISDKIKFLSLFFSLTMLIISIYSVFYMITFFDQIERYLNLVG